LDAVDIEDRLRELSMPETLEVYYNKTRPDEGIMAHWAELGHALLRLQFSVNEFESTISNLEDLQSIYRVHCQLQNYYTSVYEFEERLFSFIGALTMNQAETAQKTPRNRRETTKSRLLDPNQREKVFSVLSKIVVAAVVPLKRIITALDEDIRARRINTHETFIRLRFNEGPHWTDIEDVWWDREEDAVCVKKAFRAISKQGMRLAKAYKSRTEYVATNLNAFLNALLPYLSELSVQRPGAPNRR
jgi:hypothetical protein